jgi:hypothetical protein
MYHGAAMTVLTEGQIIEEWYRKATSRSLDMPTLEAFFRFTAVWIAFNAIYTERYPRSSVPHPKERNQVIAFARDNAAAHNTFLANSEYREAVDFIKSKGVINILTGTRETVTDTKNCEEVVSCIYTIRCNFLHGDKEPNNERDRSLVQASYRIIAQLLSDPAVRHIP